MVPCSLNGSLAVFVPQETQCQGELTNPIKVRKSVGCIPEEIWSIHWAEKRGHRWRRLFHPILLHCAFLSLIRTNRFMCTASSVKPLRACYLRAPTPCSYFSCWRRQQHTVIENLESDCWGSKPGSTTAWWPRTSCQSLCCCFCPVRTRTLATSGGIFWKF